ncbi:MAG: phosphodiester glycosidase family protein [Proteiniphilum sp.]
MTLIDNSHLRKILLLPLLLLFLQGCSDKENSNENDFIYISEAQVISHQGAEITVDNFARIIKVFLKAGENISSVEIRLILANGVSMVQPSAPTAVYDLSTEVTIRMDKNGKRADFKLVAYLESAPIDISDNWEQSHSFGQLPDYLSVYQYREKDSGKRIKALIAVADIHPSKGTFKILGEKTGSKTPDKFYTDNSRPAIVLNGGFFWSGTSLGLIIRDGVTLSHAQPVVNRDYQGVLTPYYPTQGAFGMEKDGTFSARWVYESSSMLYAYPNPSPNKVGEQPQPVPSATFPAGASRWQPVEAIGAGPLLIKNGEYKNLWENELFDEASGVGPRANHPRSAIGYHPDGYLVFFACEGRNKTPNTPGLNLEEVANLLLEIGCTEAINLDGGGSSCLLINGKEAIIPSDNTQRAITNAVAIY